jgi:hypothetical protein
MTPERFRALTEAYGADLQRWPQAERASGQSWIAQGHGDAAAALADAAMLDNLLARHVVVSATAGLQRRIVAARPDTQAFWNRARLWWSGAGFAGIGLAGAVAGALLVTTLHSVPIAPSTPIWSDPVTAFNDATDWNEE